MTRDNVLVATGAIAYLGILFALAYMAVFQANHDAQTALIALASPGATAAGLIVAQQRTRAAVPELETALDSALPAPSSQTALHPAP